MQGLKWCTSNLEICSVVTYISNISQELHPAYDGSSLQVYMLLNNYITKNVRSI